MKFEKKQHLWSAGAQNFPKYVFSPMHNSMVTYIGSPKNYFRFFFPILAHSVEVEQIGIEQNYNHHYIFTPTPQFNFFICSKGESQVVVSSTNGRPPLPFKISVK